YRLSCPDLQTLRAYALNLGDIVGGNPHLDVPTFDGNVPGKVLKVDIIQYKARQLGVTSEDIAGLLTGIVGGRSITQVRASIYLVNVVARAQSLERNSPDP
ncbi:hypothetical protein MKK58_16145, partial [Methylobacterium sp. J-078]|uniref:hypothetical protein n=1 Tax=Methylobacterium sp. J-078 TaxID=2836657 RepID=UPI001FB8EC50